MAVDRIVACLGCGGLVPDIDGPSHRYMLASPGCWAWYTAWLAAPLRATGLPIPHGALTIDAYAVQHPGVPNPQSTQSVWVHLMGLYLALERGWPADRLVRVRQVAADSSGAWAWLEPPASMGEVTAIDVAGAAGVGAARTDGTDPPSLHHELVANAIRRWVDGAWAAWSDHHLAVRREADRLVARLG